LKTVYEVNLTIENDATERFEAWLVSHIEEILRIEGFEGAEWMSGEYDENSKTHWTIWYRLKDRSSLSNYQENHAKRLIGEGLAKFKGQFDASRRVLNLKQAFTVKNSSL